MGRRKNVWKVHFWGCLLHRTPLTGRKSLWNLGHLQLICCFALQRNYSPRCRKKKVQFLKKPKKFKFQNTTEGFAPQARFWWYNRCNLILLLDTLKRTPGKVQQAGRTRCTVAETKETAWKQKVRRIQRVSWDKICWMILNVIIYWILCKKWKF